MSPVKRLLPDEMIQRLLPGFVIFCVACIGGALSLVASALSIRWLHRMGSAIGVVGAIVFVLHVWWRWYVGGSESGSASETQHNERSPH